MEVKEIKIYESMYQASISYLIGGNVYDLIKIVKERHGEEKPISWDEPFEWGEDANTTNAYQFHVNSPLGENEAFYVWMAELTPYLLGHETFHLTGDILFTRGIKYCSESEEAFAYLNGWLHEAFDNNLKETTNG